MHVHRGTVTRALRLSRSTTAWNFERAFVDPRLLCSTSQQAPAISFVVNCDTQEEVDHYWEKLSEGGEPNQCGWLTDKYGRHGRSCRGSCRNCSKVFRLSGQEADMGGVK